MSPSADAAALDAAVAALRRGELVGMPTETVYGLAADARNANAVARIFALKGRPTNHPLIVHIADAEQMRAWAGQIPEPAWQLARQFWPGPMTLILAKLPSVLDAVTGGQNSVGLRVPKHPLALALLQRFEDGLAAPSANRFGHISPTRAAHVRAEFGAELPIILDGGDADIGIESTIIDARTSNLRILRPGAISAAQIAHIGEVQIGSVSSSPRVSGALVSHYAPRTPAKLCTRAEIEAAGSDQQVLALASLPLTASGIALANEPARYASALYSTLRALDATAAAQLLIEAPPRSADWLAVNDRLDRACAR
jgi:L-threonylcarbamoyladenylate synthase